MNSKRGAQGLLGEGGPLNVEVHGQVNSKAIYNDFLPESLILRLNFVVLVK